MVIRKSKTVTQVDVEKATEWLRANGAGQNVLRSNVDKVSDGFLQPGTLRNGDCYGDGPTKRIIFNGKVAYPIEALAEYMVKRGLIIESSVDGANNE